MTRKHDAPQLDFEGGTSVKRKIAVAAALAATLLGVAACNSSGDDAPVGGANVDSKSGVGKTIKVWLMVDAQTGWKEVVEEANKRFTDATGAQVVVDYQQWANHLTKLDATLAGSDVPDVIELGNTEFPKYVLSGAFAELDKTKFENSSTWLTGLSGACEVEGKTLCVPYYAGARVLIYRTDLFSKAKLQPPKTYADLTAAADRLKADNNGDKFAAFYMPINWYAAMAWVHGAGGSIAKKEGDKWVGQLSQPASVAGLQKWADLVKNYSKGDKTKDENDQAAIVAQGQVAMFYGATWEKGIAEEVRKDPNDPNSKLVPTKVKGKLATTAMPETPSFLGGSNLGVTVKSANKDLAAEWVKIFTDTKSQEALLAKGVLPNTTSLLDKAAAVKGSEAAAEAAKTSFFVPLSERWADVEKAGTLPQMLRDIVTGKKSVADAAKWADDEMNKTLNG
jgi:N,N'-diacetylchitobiose transport system substrate-binding protein